MTAVPVQSLPRSQRESHRDSEPAAEPVPPLENGDRLTRAEFERRYRAMPHVNKAELIEGIVYMPSPVSTRRHGWPHLILGGWLSYYLSKTPGLSVASDNGTVHLDNDNEPQPDLFLSLPKHLGGLAELDEDGYLNGPPDLACEIAASSAAIDLHAKFNAYRRNGVTEYLVWRTDEAEVDWFLLRDGRYEQQPAVDGLLKSERFPGLWLDVAALLAADLPRLFARLDQAAATPEHAGFIERLKTAAP